MAAEVLGAVVLLGEPWSDEEEELLVWEIDEKDEMTIEQFRRWFSINKDDIVVTDVFLPQKEQRWIWTHFTGWRRATF